MSIFAYVSRVEDLTSLLDTDELIYTVLSTEDLNLLIQGLNLDLQKLLARNHFRNIEQIFPGMQLRIPGWTMIKYITRPGDSINSLSKRFNLPLKIILRLNSLTAETTLKAGQVLFLPEPCP